MSDECTLNFTLIFQSYFSHLLFDFDITRIASTNRITYVRWLYPPAMLHIVSTFIQPHQCQRRLQFSQLQTGLPVFLILYISPCPVAMKYSIC